ncbi:MAG TPA: hypothetical protein VFX28_23030 [Methylomirabilota bacterium]|nr:hypothetical protein [Methylomirabilota bacterium]
MARVLHVLKGGDAGLAVATIERQRAAGDEVTVALLGAAPAPPLPPGVALRRVPGEASWAELLQLVFASDHVVTW